MSDEMEEIKKRLTILEKQDLWLAKQLVSSVVATELNIATRTMKGEEAKEFHTLFAKKREDLEKKLEEAKAIGSVFKLLIEFSTIRLTAFPMNSALAPCNSV